MYLYQKTDVTWIPFTTYVNQNIMLYALHLYSDVSQLFLNKIGKKVKSVLSLSKQTRATIFMIL